jgi:uncharacterized protein YegP (UPF0339 family)
MAGTGEVYERKDGKWGFRVKAGNGEIVATGQGYATRQSCRNTLKKLMGGDYNGEIKKV